MKHLKLILIDDDLDDHEFCQLALNEIGPHINCNYFTDARKGLDFLQEYRVDLVFLDIKMPALNGIETLQRISESSRQPAPPVIILSTFDDHEYIRLSKQFGAVSYMLKPNGFAKLREQLKKALQEYLN